MSATRVYVGGLSYRARERDLEKFFRKYGRIREISMKNGLGEIDLSVKMRTTCTWTERPYEALL